MSKAAINADRGEVGLTLAGREFPMLPTLAAVNAIESQIGSVVWLWLRITRYEYFPTYRELAIIAAECIRAAGKDRDDKMLDVSTDRIEEMLYAEGLIVADRVIDVLGNMCTGGSKKKADASGSPSPSERTGSTTAS